MDMGAALSASRAAAFGSPPAPSATSAPQGLHQAFELGGSLSSRLFCQRHNHNLQLALVDVQPDLEVTRAIGDVGQERVEPLPILVGVKRERGRLCLAIRADRYRYPWDTMANS
jgi:hypothetical protein